MSRPMPDESLAALEQMIASFLTDTTAPALLRGKALTLILDGAFSLIDEVRRLRAEQRKLIDAYIVASQRPDVAPGYTHRAVLPHGVDKWSDNVNELRAAIRRAACLEPEPTEPTEVKS